jgi:hypothetical protein
LKLPSTFSGVSFKDNASGDDKSAQALHRRQSPERAHTYGNFAMPAVSNASLL